VDLNQLWQKALGEIELQISRPNFVTWLKNSLIIDKKDGVVIIGLPNNFAKTWVEDKYHKIILGTLRNIDEGVRRVEYALVSQSRPNPVLPKSLVLSEANRQLAFQELNIDPNTNLNPRYTLTSFIVGASNEMAFAAVSAVIKEIATKYNPLFIYGGVGVGKTHLIQALGNEVVKNHPDRVAVKYVSSEKFTNEVIWAIKNKRMESMKEKYRTVDVLMVDDIQFIGGKPSTEQEFFHTFNALYEANKQIIISSDRSPKFIPILEDRLKSRFEGGMVVDIGYPDFELKVAVLKEKLTERGMTLSDEVVSLIANKVKKSFRELEGVLNRILFYQQVKNLEITPRMADQILAEVVKAPQKNLSPDYIIKTVSDYFEIPVADIIGHSRKQQVVEPRQVAIYFLRDLLEVSYPFIGEKLGKRDHTTILYAFEKISQKMTSDQLLNQKITMIKELLDKSAV